MKASFDILNKSSSFLQKCIRSYNGCICKNAFVIPQPSRKNAFVVTLDAFAFVIPQVVYKSAFVNTLVAFVKKTPNVNGP